MSEDATKLEPWASSKTQGNIFKITRVFNFLCWHVTNNVTTPVLEEISNSVVRVTKHVYPAWHCFCAGGRRYTRSCLKDLVTFQLQLLRGSKCCHVSLEIVYICSGWTSKQWAKIGKKGQNFDAQSFNEKLRCGRSYWEWKTRGKFCQSLIKGCKRRVAPGLCIPQALLFLFHDLGRLTQPHPTFNQSKIINRSNSRPLLSGATGENSQKTKLNC